jgi:hypothetical protein
MLIIGYRDQKVKKKLEAAVLSTIQAPRTLASAQSKADLYSGAGKRRGYRRGLLLSANAPPNWRSIHRNRTPVANAVSTPLALNVLLFVPA